MQFLCMITNILNILYCYPNYPAKNTYGNVQNVWLSHISKIQAAGFQVKPFCLSLNPPSDALSFSALDRKWKCRDKDLIDLYENLIHNLDGCNVLLNSTGINLHPDFLKSLNVFKVFQFNDDPENNHYSKIVAPFYDLCLIGNIAEIQSYRNIGVKNVEWIPLGLQPNLYNSSLSFHQVFNSNRNIDLFLMMDRLAKWRVNRLNKLSEAFPNAEFYGNGWSNGFLDPSKEVDYLLRTKISPNIHNSTGPINYRTFYTPANGALLICDNKKYLDHVFKVGIEAIGFETIEEGIDLIHYYLSNEDERIWISQNGYKRVISEYNEISVFHKIYNSILNNIKKDDLMDKDNISISKKEVFVNYLFFRFIYFFKDLYLKIKTTFYKFIKVLR